MDSIEKYLNRADEFAQDMVNFWGNYLKANGSTDGLKPEFMQAFDLACNYRNAKTATDNHRKFYALPPEEENDLIARRLAFVEAYVKLHQEAA